MKKTRKITVFVDGVDFQHELGEALGGNRVYPSVEDLKENEKCWESCGIVKCELIFKEWVEPQDIFKNAESIDMEHKEERIKYEENALLRLQKFVEEKKILIDKLKKAL